eukprot:gene19500-23318_t
MAHKYSGNIQQGLLANANTGGENVHRGIVLGALLGAAEGYRAIPAKWITGLKVLPIGVALSTLHKPDEEAVAAVSDCIAVTRR